MAKRIDLIKMIGWVTVFKKLFDLGREYQKYTVRKNDCYDYPKYSNYGYQRYYKSNKNCEEES